MDVVSAPTWAILTEDDITPAWLSDVLGTQVGGVDVARVGTGQIGTCYRIRLTGDESLPGSVLLKLPDPGSRELLAGAYRMELMFYEQIAPTLTCRVPAVHGARIEEGSGHFVLLLEDLAPLVQGDQIAGATADQVRDAALNLAGLHGSRWCDPTLLELPGLTLNDEDSTTLLEDMYPSTMDLFLDGLGELVDEETAATLRACVPLTRRWLLARSERFGLVHGDYRLDNLLFGGDAGGVPIAVVDWQTCAHGAGLTDLAYFIGAGLLLEQRREVEADLVRRYRDALVAAGVDDYPLESCWEGYRRGSFAGLIMAIAASMLVEQTQRGDDMFMAMAHRHARHALDLDAPALLSG